MSFLKKIFDFNNNKPVPSQQDVAALYNAIVFKKYKPYKQLLNKFGANIVNVRDDFGDTPLMQAVNSSSTGANEDTPPKEDYMGLLIQAGADVDLQNDTGFTALMYAALNGRTHAVKSLLDANANPNLLTKDNKTSSLHEAVRGGHLQFIMPLLKAGADETLLDIHGRTPMNMEQEGGSHRKEVVEIFETWTARHRQREIKAMYDGTQQAITVAKGGLRLQPRIRRSFA